MLLTRLLVGSISRSFMFAVVVSCEAAPSTTEYNQALGEARELRDSLDHYKTLVDQLRETPSQRLAEILKMEEGGDLGDAEVSLQELLRLYPASPEAKIAIVKLAEVTTLQEQARREAEERKEEEDQLRRLGLRALRETSVVDINDVTLRIQRAILGDQWVVDRYDNHWVYYDARRGNQFIVVDVAISAETQGPVLPPIYAYRSSNGKLGLVGILDYRFYRWKNYGTYLGNYADFGNDFAHTKTIKFTAGLELSQAVLDDAALIILVGHEKCFHRRTERFENPPVQYYADGCKGSSSLSAEQVRANYTTIKILGKEHL